MDRSTEIRELYAYNRWANARIRAASGRLNAAEFARNLESSFPSIRDTMLHIMASEWVWLARWLGSSPMSMPEEWLPYTFDDIEQEWSALEAAQSAFIDNLKDEDLDRDVAYVNFRGESHTNRLWQLMRHVVNHSTYHRGQITTMLRQMKHEAASTDLVVYYRQLQAETAQTQS